MVRTRYQSLARIKNINQGREVVLVEPSSPTFLEYRLNRILQREVGSQRGCDRVQRLVSLSPGLDGSLVLLGASIANRLYEASLLSEEDAIGAFVELHEYVQRHPPGPADSRTVD